MNLLWDVEGTNEHVRPFGGAAASACPVVCYRVPVQSSMKRIMGMRILNPSNSPPCHRYNSKPVDASRGLDSGDIGESMNCSA